MSDAEKVVNAIEKNIGPVSFSTVIAVICLLFILFMFFYTKIWPLIQAQYKNRLQKAIQKEKEKTQISEIVSKQGEHESQLTSMMNLIQGISDNVDKMSRQVNSISGETKVSISVLLDIVECMQAKVSPEECAQRAQRNVNAFYREGKLPPTMLN